MSIKIHAKLHKITKLESFAQSYLSTSGKPTTGFVNWGKAKISLVTDFPTGLFPEQGSFFPPMSIHAETDASGEFRMTVPEAFAKSKAYLVAYDQVGTVQPLPNIPPVPVFVPIYRSATFATKEVTDAFKKIYVHAMITPDEKGFSQAQIDEIIADKKKAVGFSRLSATVSKGYVACTGEKQGATATFKIRPRGTTVSDLNKFIELKADDIDIDLPGPDFIVGMCVSEEDLQKQLKREVAKLSSVFNQAILDAIPAELRSLVSLTVHAVRYPQTGEKVMKLPGGAQVTVPTRSIVPDVAIGVEKNLY